MRELVIDKLRVGWRIRARRYERKGGGKDSGIVLGGKRKNGMER